MSKSAIPHVPKPKRNGSGKIVKVQKTVSHGTYRCKRKPNSKGVKMSNELWNIVKVILIVFILAFAWNEAVGKMQTTIAGGTVTGGLVSEETEKEVEAEEEPDCE